MQIINIIIYCIFYERDCNGFLDRVYIARLYIFFLRVLIFEMRNKNEFYFRPPHTHMPQMRTAFSGAHEYIIEYVEENKEKKITKATTERPIYVL